MNSENFHFIKSLLTRIVPDALMNFTKLMKRIAELSSLFPVIFTARKMREDLLGNYVIASYNYLSVRRVRQWWPCGEKKNIYILFSITHSFRLFNLTLLCWIEDQIVFPSNALFPLLLSETRVSQRKLWHAILSYYQYHIHIVLGYYQRTQILLHMVSFIYPSIALVFINSTFI